MSTNPAQWRKSSRSNDNGQCVELSNLGAVRDSKNPAGPPLRFRRGELGRFLDAAKASRFDG